MSNQMTQMTGSIDLEGFQVVKSEMFAHIQRVYQPSCTLWPTKICFNSTVAFTHLSLIWLEVVKILSFPALKAVSAFVRKVKILIINEI